MKKILSVLAVIVLTSLQANAFDFSSMLSIFNKASEEQATQAVQTQTAKTLADVQTQMSNLDASVQQVFLNIVSELSNRKEVKEVKKQVKSNSTALNDIISNYANTLAQNKDEVVKKISKLSSKEKTNLVNNIATLSGYAQQYVLLATDGVKTATNTIKSAQKISEVTTTLTNLNKVATDLKSRAKTVVNFTSQIKNIAQAAGLSVQ